MFRILTVLPAREMFPTYKKRGISSTMMMDEVTAVFLHPYYPAHSGKMPAR
jgi:hypothetical protein